MRRSRRSRTERGEADHLGLQVAPTEALEQLGRRLVGQELRLPGRNREPGLDQELAQLERRDLVQAAVGPGLEELAREDLAVVVLVQQVRPQLSASIVGAARAV